MGDLFIVVIMGSMVKGDMDSHVKLLRLDLSILVESLYERESDVEN